MPTQNDSWWHLRVGQEIWRLGSPLYTDTFSYTASGAVWRNHEWLTQLGFYAVYTLGGMPLLTFVGAVLVTTAWAISWSLMSGPVKWRVLLVSVALPANAVGWSIRPQLVTLCFLPLVMWCLLRQKFRWLPPIFLLWANLHAGVVAGLIVTAVAFTIIVIQDRSQWRAPAAVLALSALATLVNPLGIGLWITVFESIGRGTSVGISEFRSAGFLTPEDLPFWVLALLLGGLSIRSAIRNLKLEAASWTAPYFPLVGASLFLIPAALRYGRNIPLFLLLAVPAITWLLTKERLSVDAVHATRREHYALNVAMLVAFMTLAGGSVAYAWHVPVKRLQWEPLSRGAITAVTGCPGPLYNRYDDGGFLLWFVPTQRVFVDSRQDPYPLALLQEHLRSENAGEYSGIFARYGIHCAFLPPESPVAKNLLRDRWIALYQDSQWLVLRDVGRP